MSMLFAFSGFPTNQNGFKIWNDSILSRLENVVKFNELCCRLFYISLGVIDDNVACAIVSDGILDSYDCRLYRLKSLKLMYT